MKPDLTVHLSKRERQILDTVYRLGRATAAEVQASLPDHPSYSAVRGILRILELKGFVRHEEENLRYVFLPTVKRETAMRSALKHFVDTFFQGSEAKAVAGLLDLSVRKLSQKELHELASLIDEAREKK